MAEGLRGDDADDLVVGVKQWHGRKYLKDLSKATQRGMIRLATRGFWIGGTPPFGFDLRYEDINGTALYIVRFMADGSKHLLSLDGSLQRIIPRREQIVRGSSDRAPVVAKRRRTGHDRPRDLRTLPTWVRLQTNRRAA